MKMNNLNRAESHQRLKAQIIHQDEKYVSVSETQIDNISDDVKNVQLSNNPRNSYLTIGFGIISFANIFVGLLTKCFPNSTFIDNLFIISLSIAILVAPFFFYQFKNFKPRKSKTLEGIKVLLSKHEERDTVIDDMPFNEAPRSLNPPPNNGLRIESG